jgi:hypothetical protein
MQPRDDARRIERGLERRQRRAVQLVERPALVAELAQPLEDLPVDVEATRRARRDDKPGRVRLEPDAGVAIGVEQLQRPPVESEQRADAGVEAIAAGAAPEAPEPADERRIEAGRSTNASPPVSSCRRPSRTIPGAGSGYVKLGETQPVLPRETPPIAARSSTRRRPRAGRALVRGRRRSGARTSRA